MRIGLVLGTGGGSGWAWNLGVLEAAHAALGGAAQALASVALGDLARAR